MKKLTKKLNENSTASRCPTVADCIERVKKNKRPTTFIHVNQHNAIVRPWNINIIF